MRDLHIAVARRQGVDGAHAALHGSDLALVEERRQLRQDRGQPDLRRLPAAPGAGAGQALLVTSDASPGVHDTHPETPRAPAPAYRR